MRIYTRKGVRVPAGMSPSMAGYLHRQWDKIHYAGGMGYGFYMLEARGKGRTKRARRLKRWLNQAGRRIRRLKARGHDEL